MSVLLDTHVLLWFLADDSRLSAQAAALIEDESVDITVSVASLWEIALKITAGRFGGTPDLLANVNEFIGQLRIRLLAVERDHVLRTVELPKHHVDPFDRLLVAQAQMERIPILTSDPLIRKYAVETIW
jgi:PIN domain nuclease of toxin-antitoxin system